MEKVAETLGIQIRILNASTQHEIDQVFAAVGRNNIGAVIVSPDAFFTSRREQLVALAARHAVPVIYHLREAALAGGLMSYGQASRKPIFSRASMPPGYSKAPSRTSCRYNSPRGSSSCSI
jgi:ABC-type uncharacterized transport system substrate-binding protein